MIKIAVEAVNEVIADITDDEDIVDAEVLSDDNLRSVSRRMTSNGDEVFVRLALEQALKDNNPADYGRFSHRFEDELEPLFLDMYQKLWGPLPDGPGPLIEYVKVWKPQQGQVSTYQRADWFKLREELYGPAPYDFEALRALALEAS
jgi:hypothetical protein